jgi:hypothetical protein
LIVKSLELFAGVIALADAAILLSEMEEDEETHLNERTFPCATRL